MVDETPDFDLCPFGPFGGGGKQQKKEVARILKTYTILLDELPEPKRSMFLARIWNRNRSSKGIPAREWFKQVMGRDFS
jgi:hypothetical protein